MLTFINEKKNLKKIKYQMSTSVEQNQISDVDICNEKNK